MWKRTGTQGTTREAEMRKVKVAQVDKGSCNYRCQLNLRFLRMDQSLVSRLLKIVTVDVKFTLEPFGTF